MPSKGRYKGPTNGKHTETAPSAEDHQAGEFRRIPLALIDEPEVPERETMEPEDLAELSLSIREVGLIKPLVVKPREQRYEVVAGHRRLLACRMAEYDPVPCLIKASETIDSDAIKVHENGFSEAVNPVEEARFFARLLNDRCNNDVDQLCIVVRRRREYVEDRLLLLRWDPTIVEAVHQRRISMAVGRELAKVKDPKRLLILLDVAKTQGATARQVAQWRQEADQLAPIGDAPAYDPNIEAQPQLIPPQPFMRCIFCESTEHPYMMEMFFVHKPCYTILLRLLNRQPAEPAQT